MILFEEVSFTYPAGVRALTDVSLELTRGCLCIIGQNGGGKTTLVKHMNGLCKPTAGKVLVGGEDTSKRRVAQLARKVALAFQNPDDQLFQPNVKEEVRFGPSNLGYDRVRVDELVDRALGLLDLRGVASKRPHELELSWRKKVAIASVVAMDTPAIVLDEPTGGQDAPGVSLLGNVIETLVSEGKMVIA